ncbi:hypothetical protein [Rubrivivax rivuli]|uniref:Uncharacterized protein n=1 Tax=Rubrivivax rivuli TaxID=1862385 RepID=A0A437RHG9_9BURK|nr:hypothetical protein [Rubrivivax rivuli]RVU46227.1 hypothetical protein EOE66_10240 [Rubrivivax rivuli]
MPTTPTVPTDTGTLVEQGTPLVRNHWFDGKFLRADDLARDQDYHRSAQRLATQAGGFGVVHGLEVSLHGSEIRVQPGLGVTADGELLMLGSVLSVGVDALIAASLVETPAPGNTATAAAGPGHAAFAPCVSAGSAEAPGPVATGWRLYRLTLSPHRALCGFEDVVGALCDRACVSERQRPYQMEGVRLRARAESLPLPPRPGFEVDGRHARSRIASALFGREDSATAPLPDNGGRLLGPAWCSGAPHAGGSELTLGYLVRNAGTADFIDLWAGRRERFAPQAPGYWERRTRRRPHADFMAQVAQFQCQLAGLLKDGAPPVDEGGDCEALRGLVRNLQAQLAQTLGNGNPETVDWTQATSVATMKRLSAFVAQAATTLQGAPDRVLLERGIVEVPPAGFLPVTPNGAPVLKQVQALLGPGVQLQLCSAPLDAIGHLFEEAQHSARSSLTRGLADPADKPLLQIIVPDGQAQASAPVVPPGYAVAMQVDPAITVLSLLQLLRAVQQPGRLAGAAAASAAPSAMAPGAPVADAPEEASLVAARTQLAAALARRNTASFSSLLRETASAAATATSAAAAAAAPAATAIAAPPPSAAAPGAAVQVPAVNVARGAGRVPAGAAGSHGFTTAVQGLPAEGEVQSQEFEAAWVEAQIASDPFTAAGGSTLAVALRLSEVDRSDDDKLPPTARVGYTLGVTGQLKLDADAAALEGFRAEIEALTGLSGGVLRAASLQASLAYTLHGLGVPGTPDGPVRSGTADIAVPRLVLQRAAVGGGVHTLVLLPLNEGSLLVLEHLPAAGATAAGHTRLQMRMITRAAGTGPVTHVPANPPAAQTLTATLATLQADAQALAPGAAPRVAAEAGFAELARVLGSERPNATDRERLLGGAGSGTAGTTGLQALHEWVLFRRPVDARCNGSAPVPAPTPQPAPPTPTPPAPVLTTRYQAAVLRLVPSFNGNALQTTLDALGRGQLPTDKAATFALASALTYNGNAVLPTQTAAQLSAAFAQAGFGPVLRRAVLQRAAGVDTTLEDKRASEMANLLGVDTSALSLLALPTLPPQVQALDGAFVYIVDPPSTAPPPPTAPVANHRQRILLVNATGLGFFNQQGGVGVLATRAEVTLKRLEALNSQYFEIEAEVRPGQVTLLEGPGSDLNGLLSAVQNRGGMNPQAPLPVLLRATDGATDKITRASAVAGDLVVRVGGSSRPADPVVCTPTPPQIQSQHDALTLLFTRN